jgi:biotin transport system permease protein
MPSAARLLGLDPRLKLAWALLAGAGIWWSGAAGLWAWLAALSWLVSALRPLWRRGLRLRGGLGFVLFWGLLKAGLDLWAGAAWTQAAAGGALLALRLFCLLLLGLILALSTPPRQCGLALSWAGRPLLGSRAWEPALALALMVHFLPLGWRIMGQVRRTLALRCPHLPLTRRWLVFASAVVRNLARRSWEQAVAVAARGLDRDEVWRRKFPAPGAEWLWAAGLLAGLAVLSFV